MSTRNQQSLLESIRIVDGKAPLLDFHQRRVTRSRKLIFPKCPSFNLSSVIGELDLPKKGTYKLRVVYGVGLEKQELIPYNVVPVQSVRLVNADEVRYGQKFLNRTGIRKCLEKKGDCDDILMIQRGHLTDASYANVALYDGKFWYTPAWPLLRGCRREKLIAEGQLRPTVIRDRDLKHFKEIKLINAMLPWEQAPTLPVSAIKGLP
ncbi:aminotransferase class IV [Lewinella sp. W8]|uniref:aminotransferase class IV n=1 Tax=Lewinella sp. W8 TaxID=2528208 RepID=UPI001566A928|nr:aminotransferase class IV [Lewinella sp. W8]